MSMVGYEHEHKNIKTKSIVSSEVMLLMHMLMSRLSSLVHKLLMLMLMLMLKPGPDLQA